MTPRQSHRKVIIALRKARVLRDAVLKVQSAMQETHGSHTHLAAQAARVTQATMLAVGLTSDLLCESGDLLLKDVPK